jgi:starch synthase (maltosyl-transferring)
VALDMPALGFNWGDRIDVVDQLSGAHYEWGQYNYVRLDPQVEPAHIFVITPVSIAAASAAGPKP